MIEEKVRHYVEQNIADFHRKRLESLEKLKLSKVLKRKNPYLFKAKNMLTAEQIVRALVDAHISSNEETIFGDWLEGLAIYICAEIYGGRKSGITGIDLEFDKDNVRYIVSIKSGPNWGNSSQIKKMVTDFNTARKALRTSGSNLNIVAVNGCCYGQDNNPDKNGQYYKFCGQQFWEFISGNTYMYLNIIEPLGAKARQRNDEYAELYAKSINRFTMEFAKDFCSDDGAISWEKLVKFNSVCKSLFKNISE